MKNSFEIRFLWYIEENIYPYGYHGVKVKIRKCFVIGMIRRIILLEISNYFSFSIKLKIFFFYQNFLESKWNGLNSLTLPLESMPVLICIFYEPQ